MIIRAKAPFRIGLAGGGTDVSPYSEEYGGAILNATINLFAHTTIIPKDDGMIKFNAVDHDIEVKLKSAKSLEIDGVLDIQKGIYNRIVKEFTKKPLSFEMITSLDVSTGSGLGTSSTLVISIISAFVEWLKLPLGEYDIAHLAYDIERNDLKMAGGKQDQYAATFGGVNFMEFHKNGNVVVNPLRVRKEYLNELSNNLLLYYTETSRKSSDIIKEQQESVKDNKESSTNAMHALKEQAFLMKEAVLKNDLNKVGSLLHFGWQNKKNMAKGISNDFIDKLYSIAIENGAIGGKISGAGGGGFMVFYCPDATKYKVESSLKNVGGQAIKYQFYLKGVESWTY